MSSRSNNTERQSYGEQASEGEVASAHVQTTAHGKVSRINTLFYGGDAKLGGPLPYLQKGDLLYVYRDDSLYKNQSGNAKTEEYKKKVFSCLNGMPLNQAISFVGICTADAQYSNHAKYKITYTTYGIRKLRLDTIGVGCVKPFQVLASRLPSQNDKPLISKHSVPFLEVQHRHNAVSKVVPIMFAIELSDKLLQKHAKKFHTQVTAAWQSETIRVPDEKNQERGDNNQNLNDCISEIEQIMAKTYEGNPNSDPLSHLTSLIHEIYNLSQQYTDKSDQTRIKKWSMQAIFRLYTQSYFSVAKLYANDCKYPYGHTDSARNHQNINIIGLTLGRGKRGDYIDVFVRPSRLEQLQ
jgi:hypothetical protein